MAWNDVGQEQMVSYTDAQTGGFTLRANQSQSTSNQCMTKSDALAKYLLKSENMAAYANNQLVPKKEWAAGLTEFSSGFNGDVYDIKYQPDGKVIIGGAFTTYKGITVNCIARLFPDGTLDTDFITGGNCNNAVTSIAVLNDGRIAIGGAFTTYAGITVNRFCILNSSGSLNTTMSGANGNVRTIAVKGSYFYIGGDFTTFNGASRNRITSFNINDTFDTNAIFIIGTGFNNIVYAIHIGTDNWIYAGGTFTSFKGSTANRLIRISDAGSLLTSYDIRIGGVNTITTTNSGVILCGGDFTNVGGVTRNRAASFNTTGTDLNYFGSGFNSNVDKITVVENDQLVVSGMFGTYNGQTVKVSVKLFFGLQIYNLNTNFTPEFNNRVYTQAIDSNNNILYGGFFTIAADPFVSRTSNRIAQFSSAGILISN